MARMTQRKAMTEGGDRRRESCIRLTEERPLEPPQPQPQTKQRTNTFSDVCTAVDFHCLTTVLSLISSRRLRIFRFYLLTSTLIEPNFTQMSSRRGGRDGASRGGRGDLPRGVQVSKKMSWLLRHNAEKQGLKLGPGGYVNAKDAVSFRFWHHHNIHILRILRVC